MAEGKLWYLIAYDIRDQARLRRVAKHLKGYGVRMQYSIFRCRLTDRGIERLKWELLNLMGGNDDLLVVGLCEKCASRISKKGSIKDEWLAETASYEIV